MGLNAIGQIKEYRSECVWLDESINRVLIQHWPPGPKICVDGSIESITL